MLSRLIFGTRTSLLASAQGLGIVVVLGVPLGLLSGYVRGWIDATMSRIADGLLSLPPLVLALSIVGFAGPGLTIAMFVIGIVLAPRFFRIARVAAMSVREEAYIEAARGGRLFELAHAVAPCTPQRVSGPLLVQCSFALGFIITAEASLSYIGLGVTPPTSSWGINLRAGYEMIHEEWFPLIPPAFTIAFTGARVHADRRRIARRDRP